MSGIRKVMLRTRREKVSLMSGGPDLPKCDMTPILSALLSERKREIRN